MRSLALVLTLAAVAQAKPPQVKQLKSLPPAAQVQKQFAREAENVRVLILASPTCGACRRGVAAVVRDVLGLTAPKLRAYIVWVPMIEGDSAEAARLEASLYQDKRISHFWDEDGKLAAELGPRLGLGENKKAWDVYMIYDKRVKWTAPPSLWMHQLDGVKLAPWLDSVKLRGKVEDLLR